MVGDRESMDHGWVMGAKNRLSAAQIGGGAGGVRGREAAPGEKEEGTGRLARCLHRIRIQAAMGQLGGGCQAGPVREERAVPCTWNPPWAAPLSPPKATFPRRSRTIRLEATASIKPNQTPCTPTSLLSS